MYERTYHNTVLKTDEKPSRKKAPLRRINWKLVVRVAIAVIVIVGVVILIRLPRLQVKTIEVNGTNVAYPGDVSEFVQNKLQGNVLFILPKTSIFLIQEHHLEKEIKAAFPRFQTVAVNRKNFSALSIDVSEYQGVYLWCTDPATCYFMDQNGVVFAQAPYYSGDAYPKLFIGSLQSLPFQALTPDQLATVGSLMNHLIPLGIAPAEFHYTPDGHELDIVFAHTTQQSILKFDPTMPIADQINALFTGLRTEPLASKFRDSKQVLQYIDVRFPDRVIYKFQ